MIVTHDILMIPSTESCVIVLILIVISVISHFHEHFFKLNIKELNNDFEYENEVLIYSEDGH